MSHPNKQPPARVYAEALESYYQLGWNGILPLPVGQKSPPPEGFTGWTGDWPSYADLYAWAEERPGANVGLRMPEHVIGIDVDNYSTKTGGETLAAHETKWGTLPPTWRSTSRDDGVSGIRFYSIPTGLEWVTGLPSIELIHFGHRYAVVAPSIHPEGRPYRWIDPDGTTSLVNPSAHDMPPLPAAWILGLAKGPARIEARADLDDAGVSAWLTALPDSGKATCASLSDWTAKAVRMMGETHESRHDVTRDRVLSIVRSGADGHPGVIAALDRMRAAFIRIVIGDNSRTMREASSEWGRILSGAVRIVAANPQPSVVPGDPCGPVIEKLVIPPRPSVSEHVPDPGDTASPQVSTGIQPGVSEYVPDSPDTPTTSAAALIALLQQQQAVKPAREPTSWALRSLDPSGRATEEVPMFLYRMDGHACFYEGRINGIIGPSESGKSWLALLACVQTINMRRHVLYLDFEDSAISIVTRLKALGLDEATIIERFHYIRPDEPLTPVGQADLTAAMTEVRPAMVVLDGVNAAMSLLGKDLMSNRDATEFGQVLLQPLTSDGAAVVYLDHVTKNSPGEVPGGIGAQAKRAVTTGCCLRVEAVAPFGRGQRGEIKIYVDKDRVGAVREASELEGSNALFGIAEIVSTDGGKVVTIRIKGTGRTGHVPVSERRYTGIMEEVSRFLEDEERPVSGNGVIQAITGRAEYVRQALSTLLKEGYVTRTEGRNRSWLYVHVKPYRQTGDDDPNADPFGSDYSIQDQQTPGVSGVSPVSPGESGTHRPSGASVSPPVERSSRGTGHTRESSEDHLDVSVSGGVSRDAPDTPAASERRLDFNDNGELVDLDSGEIIDQNDVD